MNSDYVLHLCRRALETTLLLSAPVLAVAMIIGFGTALLQAVTSIKDMTLGMVLKLGGVALTLLVAGNWMIQIAVSFTAEMFSQVQALGH